MTYYDITRNILGDLIMGYDIDMDAYHDVTMHIDVSRTLIHYVLLCLIVIFLFSS